MSKILIRKAQGTMGMGTGSDLRIYNPRSESSTMFRHNHEDEDSVHSPEDGKYRDERTAKKKKEREDRAAELKNIKHIPIKTTDLHEDVDEDLEPTKFDRELEPSLMTGTHGNFGAMTSMANQARGPGFAGGHAFAMGEPMDIAFQLLKRQTTLPGYDKEGVEEMVSPENRNVWISARPGNEEISSEQFNNLSDAMLRELATLNRTHGPFTITSTIGRAGSEKGSKWDDEEPAFMLTGVPDRAMDEVKELADRYGQDSIGISDAGSEGARFEEGDGKVKDEFGGMRFDPSAQYSTDFPSGQRLTFTDWKPGPDIQTKSVMVLKRDERQGFVGRKPKREKGAKARKDYRERSRQWRPSTGEFKRPPGGMTPSSATGRRAKSRMRGIKGGKKTGLSRAHLAVEMSHRGVKTKQPKSKDPRAYRQYMGQQEARKRLGNVRTVSATPARFGARSYRAGRTGGGMLQSQLPGQAAAARQSAMRRIRPPRIPSVRMPSVPNIPGEASPSPPMSVMGQGGGQVGVGMPKLPTATVQGAGPGMVLAGKVGVGSELQKRGLSYYDMAELRQLVNEARRAMKRKETKRKGMGTKDTSGAGSNLPKHPENGPKQTTRPEGATEDANNEPRTFGLDPIGHLVGRGGRTP